jgi:molecular chaperone GrpE
LTDTKSKKIKIVNKNKKKGPAKGPVDDNLSETNDETSVENPTDDSSQPDKTDIENVAEDSVEDAETRLESAERKAEENYDLFVRLSAEFENFKKRSQREIEEFRKYANESIIKEILPVVDNLERAILSSSEDGNPDSCMVAGVELTLKEILKVFEKFGVTPVEAVGNLFDPAYHQAVMQEPSEDCPENTVIKELQTGYMLRDRLIRPAMVAVSSGKSDKSDNESAKQSAEEQD